MRIIFTINAWEDYNSWLRDDRKKLIKINTLIKEIIRTPFTGKGKPEPLKYDLAGFWSRRIDTEHRLVYRIEDKSVLIYSCRYHYD